MEDLDANAYPAFIRGPGIRVVAFLAAWCPPCDAVRPLLRRLAAELRDRGAVGVVDVDRHGELAGELGVNLVPRLVFYEGGQPLGTVDGVTDYDTLRRMFRRGLSGMPARALQG